MKKLFAILLAVAMVMGLALTASAATTTLDDLDCSGWWVAHSAGVVVDDKGVEITFTNTTYADASANWNGPIWVLYAGNEAKVNGDGYAEYWVERGDIFGWAGGALGSANTAVENADALAALGVTHEAVGPADWAEWLTALKAGIECKLVAKRVDGNIVATLTVGDAVSTVTVPFPANQTAYISLGGELTTLTNIKVKTPDPVVEVVPDVVTDLLATETASGWNQADINTTLWGGTLDTAIIVESGYMELTVTGTDLWSAHVMLNGTAWKQLDFGEITENYTPNADGSYTFKITYEDLVALYGSDDFSTVGSISIATNAGGEANATLKYVVPGSAATGDSIAVVFALLVVSALGIAVVAKKKEF